MRISDWSSDVCSSDLPRDEFDRIGIAVRVRTIGLTTRDVAAQRDDMPHPRFPIGARDLVDLGARRLDAGQVRGRRHAARSGEHTSELQSLMRTSYAGFRLKKKNNTHITLIIHLCTLL